MPSFFLAGAEQQLKSHPLLKLSQVIDWEEMRPLLKGIHKRDTSHGGGRTPYDPLSMFKAILLGQWHRLSDPELEQALMVRLDFLVFCGFELGQPLPDETTLCRFRNRLIELERLPELLTLMNTQLEKHGIKVKETRGAIIDATIIQSASRPDRYIDSETEPPRVVDSVDRDARWVKKGKQAYFGYRAYVAVDSHEGYIDVVHTRPANEAEVSQFPHLVECLPPGVSGVLADKGFASAANRETLAQKGLADFIMHKASRGKPLAPWWSALNKMIGRVRYKVERAFGTLKRQFGMARARYMGFAQVHAQMVMAAINFNLLKAANRLVC